MNGRVSFVMLVVAVLAFACTRSRSPESLTTSRSAHRPHGASIASSLDVRVDEDVHFALNVRNDGDRKVEVNFPSGMTHDITVVNEQGREVWRWSDGRLFTAAYTNKVLRTDDTLSFRESWRSPPKGTYTAIARIVSANYPQEQRVQFAVR